MRVEFSLPIGPFSINRTYYRDRRHKTKEYRDWELQVFSALGEKRTQAELGKIRSAYVEGEHCFSVEFTFAFDNLLNKAGGISSRVEDLSNVEKMLLDVLFLPKYHVQPYPYGCPNINTDDKYVLRLLSQKVLAEVTSIGVVIDLIPHPKPFHP